MNITTFIIDCDGVLNDGKQAHTYNSSDPYIKPFLEKPFKFFHSRDKTAIRYLTQTLGKRVIIISADDSDITRAWAESCGAEFMYRRIKVFSDEDGINWNETVGVGDDTIDLPYLEKCAHAFCPADANMWVRATATTLSVNGGEGVISHLLWYLAETTLMTNSKKATTMKFKAEEIERWEKRTPYNVEYSKIEEIDGDIASIDIPIKHFDEIIEQLELPLGTLFYFKVKPDFLYNDWWKDEPIIWLGQADGSFVIYIDPARISEVKKLHLLFSMLSAYRWQMQRTNSNIGSVVFNSNYENFIAWVCEKTGESRYAMDHYMYEVSPYHNDSIMFACECLGVERPTIESFKITPELLKRLDK